MPRPNLRATLLTGGLGVAEQNGYLLQRLLQDGEDISSSDSSDGYSGMSTDNTDTDSQNSDQLSISSTSSISDTSSMSVASSDSSLSSSSSSGIDSDASGALSSDEDEDEAALKFFTSSMDSIEELMTSLVTERVLFPAPPVPKESQLFLVLFTFRVHHPTYFRRNLRVSPETFDHLAGLIQNDIVFQSNSNHKQLDPTFQLAIALFRFGHYGNASSVQAIAQWAGCSAGLVISSTRRVMTALLRLHDQAMAPPSDQEIAAAKAFTAKQSCPAWRGGWCMVDGTLVPLAFKPGHYGEAYFDRKSNYSLNVQIVNLPNYRIIDYVVGPCGSSHDSSVFARSTFGADPGTFLSPGEWIWADSAYGLYDWCIVPFKKPLSELLGNARFNFHLSRVRIKSEHCIGYVKGRLGSLRGLSQQITDARYHQLAVSWVTSCLILHNLIIQFEKSIDTEDPWYQAILAEGRAHEVGEAQAADAEEGVRTTAGKRKRVELRDALDEALAAM